MDAAAPVLDTGDTAWMLVSAAMVLFMIPGLVLFYGGLARSTIPFAIGSGTRMDSWPRREPSTSPAAWWCI